MTARQPRKRAVRLGFSNEEIRRFLRFRSSTASSGAAADTCPARVIGPVPIKAHSTVTIDQSRRWTQSDVCSCQLGNPYRWTACFRYYLSLKYLIKHKTSVSELIKLYWQRFSHITRSLSFGSTTYTYNVSW